MGKIILTGAGPGDSELITLKAIKALQKADVVLYDALANPELLDYCSEHCIKVYVGKKAGIHSYQQIYINDMLVDYAQKHDTVVRLKGGDPFVFGRGHEELEHAMAHNIEVEIIPGISSSLSVPATNYIPLTKRGVNESFWVITGTTTNLEVSKDLELAAQSTATVIILMGMKNLGQITKLFSKYRGPKEAIGIIQNGTCSNERRVFSDLAHIEKQVALEKLESPSIIVIGEVVKHRPKAIFEYMNSKALQSYE
ncbi:uroporphyrinogen-III C-methyltransferase [Fulvivirga ligni]|uniref:uroporphyrinogen-III C-methyltransferase n=1 Tax=Fulvivirga ligni TaxID=2904246 RepID=UPI001F1841C4|nr:uroporphyrinogen-III C-methyltransferase [Fulvivirga ligni]UII22397.1 uroporphyrinogen-III C-methyltransferase [Fulvivirga ligni]